MSNEDTVWELRRQMERIAMSVSFVPRPFFLEQLRLDPLIEDRRFLFIRSRLHWPEVNDRTLP